MKRIGILGVEVDAVTAPDALVTLREGMQRGERQYVVTVNPEIITHAQNDQHYRHVLNAATVSVADGAGTVWAARYLQSPPRGVLKGPRSYIRAVRLLGLLLVRPRRVKTVLPETIPGSDLTIDICGMCEEFGFPLFLLGAGDGVAEAAAEKLKEQFPRLHIAGAWEGSPREDTDGETRRRLVESGAQVVLVAFGAPKQEKWIARNIGKLPAPLLAMGVGGTFDYLAGAAPMAGGRPAKPPPSFIRRRGLEWLWRLFTQPSRWRRIVTAFPVFVRRVVRETRR